MVRKSILVNHLQPYTGTKKPIIYNQSTNDIIDELLKAHKVYANQYDKIYKYFDTGNLNSTIKNLFDFCKKNIEYKIESGDSQSLKSPAAILIQGYGDCKQYSQFIAGVLDAINRNSKKINWCYRFASYNNKKQLQHVFVVVKQKNNEVWIDPVLDYLDEKKQYNFKLDKMALYQISGFENEENQQIGLSFKKIGRTIKKIRIKDISIKNIKNLALKVTLAPSRNAFLGLVSVNAFGLAANLAKAIQKDRSKVQRFWKDVGGDFSALIRAVNNRQSNKVSGYIGDPATGTAAAAASPILVAVAKLLKDLGIDPKDLKKSVLSNVENQIAKTINTKGKDLVENGFKSIVKKKPDGSNELVMEPAGIQPTNEFAEKPKADLTPTKNNTILYVAGGAAALYLLTKKR